MRKVSLGQRSKAVHVELKSTVLFDFASEQLRTTMLFLPVEVLELIVQATEIPDQLTLCISSKVLNELAVRSLYRRIDLAQPLVKAIRCCKTLVSNEAAALSVRSIRIGDGVS